MSLVNKPNFFIVGAPKCGTTALYSYLAGHPDICMSKIKEPHFFAPDTIGHQRPSATLEKYLANFDGAAGKSGIGEASTGYLSSRAAPREILHFNPSARIIVMLRNPVDVMHAMHSQRILDGREHIAQFERALDSQETRYEKSAGFRGQPALRSSYRETTRFSEQVQRYFDTFGRACVHVIWFKDFALSPAIEYDKVLSFLGLGSDRRHDFAPINANKVFRNQAAQRWMWRLSARLGGFKRSFPTVWREVSSISRRLNHVYVARPAMEAGFRRQLEAEYAPELRNLERLLGRTLT